VNVFHFGIGTRRLFGVYRPGVGEGTTAKAAVLCAPWGQEYIRAHRSVRQLGIQLNAAGFHVLRFDYYGTGDSAGDMTEATVKDWEEDVGLAVDELRDSSGASRVSLIGLRLGATLAASCAASRPQDVRELVLWDPVVSGREYLSELRAAAGAVTARRPAADSPLEVNGFPLSSAMAAELDALDLVALADRLPARTLALSSNAASANAPALQSFRSALERRGPTSTLEVVEAPPAWIEYRGSGTALMPVAILQRITQWVK
jgi:exosortase A-associated hydrolase 2